MKNRLMDKLRIKQIRGSAGKPRVQRLILKTLGLKHTGDEKKLPNLPTIRGMIKKVSHLVYVEEFVRK